MSQAPARVSAILREAGTDAWAAAVTHPMVRAIADGSLPHETFHRYFDAERPLPRGVRPRDRAHRSQGARTGTRSPRSLGSSRRSWRTSSRRTWRSSNGWAETRRPLDGRGAMLPTTYAYTRHSALDLSAGRLRRRPHRRAAVPMELRRARAAADGEPARRSRSTRTGSRCSATTRTTVSSRRRRRCSTGSSTPETGPGWRRSPLIFERSTRYEAAFWDMAYGNPRPAGLPDEGGTP